MEWDKLKVFYTVAQEGSFNKAAQRLNVAQSSIGRSISILEHSLKTKLFIRNARGVILTEDGETLYHHVRNMIIEAENARTAIQQKKTEVEGKLVLAAPHGFMTTSASRYLIDFCKLYPKVRFVFICNDENLDLRTREADVGLRTFDPTAGNSLVQTYLISRVQHLYASPQYLRENGIPKTLEELEKHRFISFDNPFRPLPYGEIEWIRRVGREETQTPRDPYLTFNSVELLYQAAVNGLGIIALSHDSNLLEAGEVVRILPEISSPETKMYFVYPTSLKTIKLVKTLESYLVKSYKTKDNPKVSEK